MSKSNSFFLFGARGTGKTTLLSQTDFLKHSLKIDLLEPSNESRYSMNPNLLLEECENLKPGQWVILDEIQKLPKLLDLVHKIIEERKIKFALTGSSARKLKRGGANLLAGRAFVFHLYPLLSREIGPQFDLELALNWGTLPKLFEFNSPLNKTRFLNAYVHTYIKEEIQVEQLVRNLDPFRLFLPVAAQMNGEVINYSNISRDTGADIKSVQTYFQILVDTHLGCFLNPYQRSVRKVQRQSPKFYFFDLGVKRALDQKLRVPITAGTSEFGNAFETFFINEVFAENAYRETDLKFSYLRTKDGVEIDLIIEYPDKHETLVEIKSTTKVDDRHLTHLKRFSNDFPGADLICVNLDPKNRTQGQIQILHWQNALRKIFE